MTSMLADQFYHQPGQVIQIDRDHLIEMLSKQTNHGIEIGRQEGAKLATQPKENEQLTATGV